MKTLISIKKASTVNETVQKAGTTTPADQRNYHPATTERSQRTQTGNSVGPLSFIILQQLDDCCNRSQAEEGSAGPKSMDLLLYKQSRLKTSAHSWSHKDQSWCL